jgi:hypothetical protein
MPEPNANSRFRLANVVVVACHHDESKGKVVDHSQNDVFLPHFVREGPIVSLVLWESVVMRFSKVAHTG